MFLTVVTPTYNREDKLPDLFRSLKKQTNKDFLWMVIDDGSEDETAGLVKRWISGFDGFPIEYHGKKNGGKHTALNLAFDMVDTEFTFIVDSDDILTEDAIEQISNRAEMVRSHGLSGVCFLRGYDKKRCIGDRFPKDAMIANDIDVRYRMKIAGDKAEIWRSDVLKEYRFPVFDDEKFMGENYIWEQIAMQYDMLYVNRIIYITEYLEGGLTKSGRMLRIRCPRGGMANSKIGLSRKFPILTRMKKAVLYDCYAYFCGKGVRENIGKYKITELFRPLGYLLFRFWNKRYHIA